MNIGKCWAVLHRLVLPAVILCASAALYTLNIFHADWGRKLVSPYPDSDAAVYLHAAWYGAYVDHDGGFVGAITSLSPYIAIQTAAYRMLGPWQWVPLATNAALVVLGVLFVALATRRAFGQGAGWAAGLLGVLAGPLVFFAGITVKTSLVVCLLGAALWAAASHFAHPRTWKAVLVTALLGVAALERYNVLLVLLAFCFVAVAQDRRRLGGFPALRYLMVPLLLVGFGYGAIWSKAQQIEPGFVSPLGLNFYVGNAPHSRGWYTPVEGLPNSIIGHRTRTVAAAEMETETAGLSRWQASRYWIRRSFAYYREHPAAYAILQLRKLGLLLAQYGHGEPEQYRVWRWDRPALRIAFADYGFVMALGLVGLVSSRRLEEGLHFRRFLAIGGALFAGSMWLFFVNDRYRISLLVILIPFAAYGVWRIWQADAKSRVRLGLAVIALYGASYLLNGLLLHGPGWPADLERKARELRKRQRHELAVYELKVRAATEPTAGVWAALSKEFRRRGFEPDAEVLARRAIALAPGRSLGYRRLYESLSRTGDDEGMKRLLIQLENVQPETPVEARSIDRLIREIHDGREKGSQRDSRRGLLGYE